VFREVRGTGVTVHDDRLHAEIDRQLAEVRAACDGLATRSGLLIAASGVGATILASRISSDHHEVLLVYTLVALGVATLSGAAVLMPSLKIGPLAISLGAWMAGTSSSRTSSLLYDGKLVILTSNMDRLLVMRTLFAIQSLTTIAAVGLAMGFTTLKWEGMTNLNPQRAAQEDDTRVIKDAAYYGQLRESVGRGTLTLLVGTSTRSLMRSAKRLELAHPEGQVLSSKITNVNNPPKPVSVRRIVIRLIIAVLLATLITALFSNSNLALRIPIWILVLTFFMVTVIRNVMALQRAEEFLRRPKDGKLPVDETESSKEDATSKTKSDKDAGLP
jgi:hypothetical protein